MAAADAESIEHAASVLVESLRAGGKVLIFGNGGSAADAQHIAAELVGRFTVDRKPLPAIALTVDTSALTAIANDYGYDHVFDRQLRALGRPGDVAIAITTSGRSESIVKTVRSAREMGMKVIGLTGAKGKAFAELCDAAVVVPTEETARIQELHLTIGHLLCAIVEAELCGLALPPSPSEHRTKTLTVEAFLPIREWHKKRGDTVVWTNGVFDILHAGHLQSLRAARAHGNVLVVGINEDAQVTKAKGEGRPINTLEHRAALLGGLEVVDYVIPFSEATPSEVLDRVRPDVHTKGADYAPPNGAPIPEAEIVRGYGGRLEFLPLIDGLSTTKIASRLA